MSEIWFSSSAVKPPRGPGHLKSRDRRTIVDAVAVVWTGQGADLGSDIHYNGRRSMAWLAGNGLVTVKEA